MFQRAWSIYRRSRLLIHYRAHSTGYPSITPDMTILFAASKQFLNTQFTLIPIRTDSANCSNNRGFMPRAGSEGMPSVVTMWQLTRISCWSEDRCLYSSTTCPLVWYELAPTSVVVTTWVGFWDVCLIVLSLFVEAVPNDSFIYFTVLYVVQMKLWHPSTSLNLFKIVLYIMVCFSYSNLSYIVKLRPACVTY